MVIRTLFFDFICYNIIYKIYNNIKDRILELGYTFKKQLRFEI
jgi:hypothetical protein